MSIFDNSPSIVRILKRKGDVSSPFVDLEETVTLTTNRIILREIPNKFNSVQVKEGSTYFYESRKDKNLAGNEYNVDYAVGLITFSSSAIGKTLTISYKGEGFVMLSPDRIYTKEVDGVITETLQNLVDDTNLAKDNANTSADNLAHKGSYDNTIQYKKRNIVSFDGTSYMALVDVLGVPPTDKTKWKKISGFRHRGVYSSATSYEVGDFVHDSTNEELYMSLVDDNLNQPLSDNTKWKLMISVKNIVATANTKINEMNIKLTEAQTAIDNVNDAREASEMATSISEQTTDDSIEATNASIAATNTANQKITEINQVISSSAKIYKGLVETYAEMLSTYPAPQVGWTVFVKGDFTEYRWDGSSWVDVVYSSNYNKNFMVKFIENTVKITSAESNVSIGITEFNPTDDNLQVFKNSVYLSKNEYTIAGDGLSIFHINAPTETWEADTEFNFIVMKNTKRDIPSADGSLIQSGSITDDKLATGIKISPALTDKDGFTHPSLKARLDDLEATPNSEYWYATEGQTVFTLSNGNYQTGKKLLNVIVGGIPQVSGLHFTETSSTSFTLLTDTPLPENTLVYAYWLEGHVALTTGHNHTHGRGGQDELDIRDMMGFNETRYRVNSQTWQPTEGQTLFTLSNGQFNVGTKQLEVYVSGVKQPLGTVVVEGVGGTSFTINGTIREEDFVEAKWIEGNIPLPSASHNSTHKKGGNDELNVTELAGYKENIDDRIGVLQSFAVNVKSFGAKGDGVTDDTTSIQNAYDSTPIGGKLYFPKGTYIGNLEIDKSITVEFQMGSKLISPLGVAHALEVRGTLSSTKYLLSSTLKRGDNQITLSTPPTDIFANDLIYITDDTVRPLDNAPFINSEVHEVLSVSGNVITLKDFIREPKSISSVNNVSKITPIADVEIINCSTEGVDGRTTNGGIYVDCAKNVSVRNFKMTKNYNPAITFSRSYNCTIDGFDIRKAIAFGAGQGYGVRVDYGSNRINVLNGVTELMRHAIDLGGAYDVLVDNVIAYDNPHSPTFVIAHNSYGSDITFRNCKSYGTKSYGFLISNQGKGANGDYDHTNYNIKLLNCEVHIPEDLDYANGVYFMHIIKESIVDGLIVKYRNGETKAIKQVIGVRSLPNQSDLTIRNAKFSGLRDGVTLLATVNKLVSELTINESAMTKLSNVFADNCDIAVRLTCANAVEIINTTANNCNHFMYLYYPANTPKLRKLTLTDVLLSNVTNFSNSDLYYVVDAKGIIGTIRNIYYSNMDKANYKTLTANQQITNLDVLTQGNGELLVIGSAAAVSLSSNPFLQGFMIGQKLTLSCRTPYDITVNSNEFSYVKTKDVLPIVLNSNARRSCSFEWDGSFWVQTN